MPFCPHCQNPVYDGEALRCLFCGELLNQSSGFLSSFKYFKGKNIAIIIGILVAVAFILWIIR